ncbi:MAG: hypothetical protein Kow0068_07990 [Marinilabiliales bacterium]
MNKLLYINKKALVFILLLTNLSLWSQNSFVDSVFNAINSYTDDSIIADKYNELAEYYLNYNPDSAVICAENAWKHSKIINYTAGKANSLLNTGKSYEIQGKYKEAIGRFKKSIVYFEDIKNINGIADANKHIGICYENLGNYDKALEHYLLALKQNEKIKNDQGIASCLNSIGHIYYYQDDYKKALEYFYKTLEITRKIDNKYATAITLNNIGNAYDKLEEYDKAMEFFKESLKIQEEIDNLYGIALCLTNIGNIHLIKKQYNESYDNYIKALKIQEELGDMSGVSRSYANIAVLYQEQKLYDKALESIFKSLEIAQETNNKEQIKYAYDIIAELYFDKGDYKNAYTFVRIFSDVKDSLINEENKKVIAQLLEQFNAEKREKEIQLLNKDKQILNQKNRQQKILLYIFISVAVVISFFLVMLIRLFIQKKKANILLAQKNQQITLQRDEIAAQRDEIEAQRDLVTKQKEHIEKIHEELTSSIEYAKRIQTAILPDADFLEKIFSDYFVLFRPHSVVSGDFYWATKINHNIIFTAADCTGHGVPGAFMSMLGMSFLNEIVRKSEIKDAASILNELRSNVIYALKQKGVTGEQKDGMDISLCVLNSETNVLQWAGGNNPLYIISNVEYEIENSKSLRLEDDASNYILTELKPDKMPIAIYEKLDPFTNYEIQLKKDDQLYMFSDGFADQFGGPKGKKFMYKPFKRLLLENACKPMNEQKEILNLKFEEWLNYKDENDEPYEQIDDVVVFGVRI